MAIQAKEKAPRRRGRKGKDASEAEPSKDVGHTRGMLVQLNEESPTWFKAASDFPERNATLLTHPAEKFQSKELVEKYRAEADEIYSHEVQLFNKQSSGDKDTNWMQATMSKGTLKDRVAAMSVTVSTDPIHRFHALDGLMQMAGCLSTQGGASNSRVAQLAGEAIIDLFRNTLLPPKRKLLTMAQRPFHLYESDGTDKKKTPKRNLSPRVLLLWRFEEMVREKYHFFISKYFGYMLREGNDLQKIPTIKSAAELLKSVPEGEATLLVVIVNKIGDPTKKVASVAAHSLRALLREHPAMQIVVAREVQQLAHRPHLSDRALYNCVTFLNQLKLRHETEDIPPEERVPSSLVQTYFRLFEVAVRVEEGKKKKQEEEIAMKGRLLSALLTGVNRAHPYLSKSLGELDDHVNSLYRVVHKSPPSACTQALLLLFHLTVGIASDEDHVSSVSTDVEKLRQKRFYTALYSKCAQPAMVGSGKHLTMFFNLVYKAMKFDKDKNRVLAFSKRILCTTLHCSSAVVSASLFLLNEIGKNHPEILHCHSEVLKGDNSLRTFDMREQDPSKALKLPNGEKIASEETRLASAWEMSLLSHHFHPTVSAFTENFGSIHYSGDPLRDITLAPFLDKFAYRNPKSSEKVAGKFSRGNSVAERRSGNERRIEGHFALPFNDPSFIRQREVDVEDQFFHQYFVERAKRDETKGVVKREEDADETEKGTGGEIAEEEGVIDAAEVDVTDFGKYEQEWDTDEEEEAFVDTLAQKIIEDEMDDNEAGPDELDDEDPDMDDWEGMYDDDKNAGDNNSDDDDDGDGEGEFLASEAAGIQTLHAVGSDEDSEKSNDDEDAFMDNSDDDSDTEPEELEINPFAGEDQDESDVDPFGEEDVEDEDEMAAWVDDDEDESIAETTPTAKNGKQKRGDTFVSLEDYEAKIKDSFQQIKRASPNDRDEEDEKPSPVSKKKKGKKRRIR
jgi:ribosome biogenesis protein MAK21